jgi:hypothetical protein
LHAAPISTRDVFERDIAVSFPPELAREKYASETGKDDLVFWDGDAIDKMMK